jgi:DNA (cytosine-5)-methyltransferase 1
MMPLTFVELFAGVGILGSAFRRAGWNCVMANDIDPVKMKMWKDNGGKPDVFRLGDCRELDENDFPASPLWTASFPCIDFSEAGSGAGFLGKHSSPVLDILERLGKMDPKRRPQCILIENVPGLAKRKNGAGLTSLLIALYREGYKYVDVRVLDAAHFSPQSRKRLFIAAFNSHSNVTSNSDAQHGGRSAQHYGPPWLSAIVEASSCTFLNLPLPLLPHMDGLGKLLKDVIVFKDVPDSPFYEAGRCDAMLGRFSPGHLEYANRMKDVYKVFSFTEHTRNGKVVYEVSRNGKSSCLRSHRGGGAMIRLLFPCPQSTWKIRNMSPQECAALQGVPSFVFGPVSNRQKYRAMGDAVCLPVIEFVAKHLIGPYITVVGVSDVNVGEVVAVKIFPVPAAEDPAQHITGVVDGLSRPMNSRKCPVLIDQVSVSH